MAWFIFAVLLQQPVPATAPTQADRVRSAMKASIEKQQESVRLQTASFSALPGISANAVQLTPQTGAQIASSLLSRILP